MATALSDKVIDAANDDEVAAGTAIALYDGRCLLCNRLLRFSTKRARQGKIQFLTLQSERGQQLQAQHRLDPQDIDSMILIEADKAFTRSDASLRILKYLRQPWPMFRALLIVPRFLRNWVYDWIGRNRYRWFGTCELPTANAEDAAQS